MNEEKQKPQGKPRPAGSGKVFDIRRPGSATTPHTSKPVIVGHKPQVRDNVLAKDESQRHDMASPHKVDVKPIHQEKPEPPKLPEHEDKPVVDPALAAVAAELTGAVEKPTEEKTEAAAPDSDHQPGPEPEIFQEPETDKPEEEPEQSKPKSFAEFAGIKEDPQADKPTPEEEAEEKQTSKNPPPLSEQLPGLEQIKRTNAPGVVVKDVKPAAKPGTVESAEADAKPFNPESVVVSKGGSISVGKLILWILAVLVLLVVIGDVLLDAGVIYSSVPIPHTHIISK